MISEATASSARVQALIAKRVGAAPLNKVFADRAAQHTKTAILGDAARDLPDLIYAWEVVSPKTLANNRDAVQSFVTATGRAARWAVANPEEAAAISRKVLPEESAADVTGAIKSFAARRFWGANGELTEKQRDFTLSAMREIGIDDSALKMSEIVQPGFAAEASKQLGPVKG